MIKVTNEGDRYLDLAGAPFHPDAG